jgi:hypothetical protein
LVIIYPIPLINSSNRLFQILDPSCYPFTFFLSVYLVRKLYLLSFPKLRHTCAIMFLSVYLYAQQASIHAILNDVQFSFYFFFANSYWRYSAAGNYIFCIWQYCACDMLHWYHSLPVQALGRWHWTGKGRWSKLFPILLLFLLSV